MKPANTNQIQPYSHKKYEPMSDTLSCRVRIQPHQTQSPLEPYNHNTSQPKTDTLSAYSPECNLNAQNQAPLGIGLMQLHHYRFGRVPCQGIVKL